MIEILTELQMSRFSTLKTTRVSAHASPSNEVRKKGKCIGGKHDSVLIYIFIYLLSEEATSHAEFQSNYLVTLQKKRVGVGSG